MLVKGRKMNLSSLVGEFFDDYTISDTMRDNCFGCKGSLDKSGKSPMT